MPSKPCLQPSAPSAFVGRYPQSFPFEPELPAAGTPRKGSLSQAFLSDVFDPVIVHASRVKASAEAAGAPNAPFSRTAFALAHSRLALYRCLTAYPQRTTVAAPV